MIDWGLWLLPVRHKCILIYGSHPWDLNQELWPTWGCTSGLSNKDLFIPPTERLAQGRGDPPSKLWTLPSTPVSSWNLLNQFLFAKLTEKVKTFCSRLRNRTSLSCPRGSGYWALWKCHFKGGIAICCCGSQTLYYSCPTLKSHEGLPTMLPCPSLLPEVCSSSYPLSW